MTVRSGWFMTVGLVAVSIILTGCSDGGNNNPYNYCYGINGYNVNGNGIPQNGQIPQLNGQPGNYYNPNGMNNANVNFQPYQNQQMNPQFNQNVQNPQMNNQNGQNLQGLVYRNTNGQISYNPQNGEPGYIQNGQFIPCTTVPGFNTGFNPYGGSPYLNYNPQQYLGWWNGSGNPYGSYIHYNGYYYLSYVYWQMMYNNYYYSLPSPYVPTYSSYYYWYYQSPTYYNYSYLGGPSYFPLGGYPYWTSGNPYYGNADYFNFGLHFSFAN